MYMKHSDVPHMEKKPQNADEDKLDRNQKKVLYVYTLYSSEKDLVFFQYTAVLAVCYYLMKQGIFPDYKEQLLVYDYKNSRRYLWEDKTFMNDINVIRDADMLIRARARSKQYRDVNSHQCSELGVQYLEKINYSQTQDAKDISKLLKCKCKSLREVVLEDEGPYLRCDRCGSEIFIEGFLYNLHEKIQFSYKPFFLNSGGQ